VLSSPVDTKGMIRCRELDILEKAGIYERGKWPAYLPDTVILDQMMNNDDIMNWVAQSKGVILQTIGNFKHYLVDVRAMRKKGAKGFRLIHPNKSTGTHLIVPES